jgi:hypothetical protein
MEPMAVPKSRVCRHCEEPFIPFPKKPGFIDECPECLCAAAQQSEAKSGKEQLEALLAYMVEHPITVRLDDGTEAILVRRTAVELEAKLKRKKLSDSAIEKLMVAYGEMLESMKTASTQDTMHIKIQGEQQTLCCAVGPSMEVPRSEFNRHPDLSPFGPQIPEHERCPDCLKTWRERPFLPE